MTEKPISGRVFVSLLVDQLKLDIPQVTKAQWSKRSTVSKTIVANAFHKFEKKLHASDLIVAIVEFHVLALDHGSPFAKRINDKAVVEKLRDSIGIYAFFDASGRVIYIGKTEKKNLLSEMDQQHRQKSMPVRIIKGGKSHRLVSKVNGVARYFSAYKIEKHLIGDVEALLTRIIVNNASNIRLESLRKPQ